MPLAAELTVLLGAFAIIGAIVVAKQRKPLAFVGSMIVIGGTVFGGLAWAGIPALISLEPGPPVADPLFSVTFLSTSGTDRTESGTNIDPDGHSITFTMSDVNMDGLGDVNLDLRVTNVNSESDDTIWAFYAEITFVSTTSVAQTAQPIVNRTDILSRWAVTWTLTDTGSPTLEQSGEKAASRDWKTGLSDQLNIDLEMSPSACDDIATGTPGVLRFVVGGVNLTAYLTESA